MQANAPHVIILMADQLRWDFVNETYMPRTTALLQESQQFSNCYCNSPLCVPSRGSFFTGTWPNTNGCLINPWDPTDADHGHLRPGFSNLYSLLAEAGYDCWHAGKQHLFDRDIKAGKQQDVQWLSLEKNYKSDLDKRGVRAPGGRTFTGVVPEMAAGTHTRARRYSTPRTGCYPHDLEDFFDGWIRDQCLQAIHSHDTSKPFFLSGMFLAPHPPLEIPEPYYSMFKAGELPDNVGRWSSDQSPLQLYNLTGAIGNRYERDDWIEIWRVYAGLVRLLDDCIGQVIDALKEQGLYDDSLIVFTSDHGEMLGSHRLWQKMCLYEESARVPLGIRLPQGQGAGTVHTDLCSLVDVFPTLLDHLQIQAQHACDGRSLTSSLHGEGPLESRPVFMQYDGNGALGNFQRGIVQDHTKVIVDFFQNEIYIELYDLDNDPQETANIIFEHSNRAEPLLQQLRNWMLETGDHLDLPEQALAQFLNQRAAYRHPPGHAI